MSNTLNKAVFWGVIGLAFLLPLFFLPITAEFYVFNKLSLLIFATGVLLILWAIRVIREKKLSFIRTPLDLPILLFALAYVLATAFASPNKAEALMNSTSTGAILALTVLYFVITNNLGAANSSTSEVLGALIASACLLALVAILQFLGLGERFAPVDWLKPKLWTPAGGPLILVSFLAIALVLVLAKFIARKKKTSEVSADLTSEVVMVVILLLLLAGLGVTIWQILPGKPTSLVLPSYQDSWAIAIEAFKQNPLFGVGPGNYLSAFNRFRPVSFNNHRFWNVRFANASSYPLELLTVGGIVTLGAWLFLVFKAVRLLHLPGGGAPPSAGRHLGGGLVLAFLLQLLLPNNFLLLFLTFLFLGLLSGHSPDVRTYSTPGVVVSRGIFVVCCLLFVVSGFLWGRVYAADFYFRQALNALAQNQGTQTYNYQIRAISLNPFYPPYRRAYSQTNFALANALAGSPRFAGEAGQADLSDQDRANIARLVQQGIREAKVATVLNRTDAVNWENLAQIYRNLLNFAQGADQWAIAAYRQAIATDPINPRIRLNLGGLYYALGQYDQAIRRFQDSVNLKPNYANGYYNLAAAYREKGMYQEAYLAMQTTLNLVSPDSADYPKAKNELDELAKKLPAEEASPSAGPAARPEEALTEPSPLPSPVIKPPLELPEGAGPP